MPPILPTPAQAKVLRWLQNQTVTARQMRMRETERERFGEPPAPRMYQKMHRNAVLRHELQNAALAGGVPQTWLDHVRERAGKGRRWSPDLYLRMPEPPVDRDHLLAALTTDALRLRQHIATAVGYGHIGAVREAGTATAFDRNLRALWTRTAAVTALLTSDTTEIRRVWGRTPDWKTAVASTLASTGPEILAQRWRSLAREDTSSYKQQAEVLAAAGITTDNQPIPAPATLIPQLRTLHHCEQLLSQNQGQYPGRAMDAAIDAMDSPGVDEPHQASATDRPHEPGAWLTNTEPAPRPAGSPTLDAGHEP
ncbi:hypothetical protein [Nocardia sputi]|uniref:hypothetical protein n=1 Tax=Nocardia sputi TaxID=2943705 RepID=UPI0020BF1088|nr:hypothetical protein [Nocardia sputi]